MSASTPRPPHSTHGQGKPKQDVPEIGDFVMVRALEIANKVLADPSQKAEAIAIIDKVKRPMRDVVMNYFTTVENAMKVHNTPIDPAQKQLFVDYYGFFGSQHVPSLSEDQVRDVYHKLSLFGLALFMANAEISAGVQYPQGRAIDGIKMAMKYNGDFMGLVESLQKPITEIH